MLFSYNIFSLSAEIKNLILKSGCLFTSEKALYIQCQQRQCVRICDKVNCTHTHTHTHVEMEWKKIQSRKFYYARAFDPPLAGCCTSTKFCDKLTIYCAAFGHSYTELNSWPGQKDVKRFNCGSSKYFAFLNSHRQWSPIYKSL